MAKRKVLTVSDKELIHRALNKTLAAYNEKYPAGAAAPEADEFFEAPDVEGKRAQIEELVAHFAPDQKEDAA